MPALFEQMPGGLVFGGVFLVLLLIAGLTTVIAVLEVMGSVPRDSLGWSRRRGVGIVAALWFLMSVPVVGVDRVSRRDQHRQRSHQSH